MGQYCSKREKAMGNHNVREPKQIYDAPINTLDKGDHCLTISTSATPCHIRLVDCQAMTNEGNLRILEFSDFPTVPYSAISYPWRGVAIESSIIGHTFTVQGAKDADPVGVDALHHACAASLVRECPYLWVDRLCIIQGSREDKHWQIRHMYKVYKSCRFCIVLAGGLQRLVRLDEETSWIHRSWTLQEVLAPPEAAVLFDWRLGSGTSMSGGRSTPITEVVSSKSAMAPISLILEASTVGSISFTPDYPEGTSKSLLIETSIFSAHPSPNKQSRNEIPFWRPQRKIFASNVAALSIAMDPVFVSDSDVRAHAVWQSALMRTSSRPVDMVFSIMGLFNIELNPSAFHEHDRRGATIALAQAILKAGGSASWLGVGLRLEPDRCLSTFPTLPRTSVAGVALVRTKGRVQEVSELVDPDYPVVDALTPLPKGTMDDAGYFVFFSKAVQLHSVMEAGNHTLQAMDGSLWEMSTDAERVDNETPVAYAVLLGWFNRYYPGVTSTHDTDNIRLMLLQEHKPGMFHLRSFFTLHRKEKSTVLKWSEREFRVGGPDVTDGNESSDELVQDCSEREQPWPRLPWGKPIVTVEDEAIRKARWAVPQRTLERRREEDSTKRPSI